MNWIVGYPPSFFCSIDKPKALSLLLHTADISHPAKNWDLHHHWTTSLLEEFFRQVRPRTGRVKEQPDLDLTRVTASFENTAN